MTSRQIQIVVGILIVVAVGIGLVVLADKNRKKLAAKMEADKVATQTETEKTAVQAQQSADAIAAAGAGKPSFDIARFEPTGDGVVAGLAQPGSIVELLVNGTAIASTTASPAGEWVIVLEKPLPPGSYDLALRAAVPGGEAKTSDEFIALMVPDSPSGEVLVVASRPGQASEILTKPGGAANTEVTPAEPATAETQVAVADTGQASEMPRSAAGEAGRQPASDSEQPGAVPARPATDPDNAVASPRISDADAVQSAKVADPASVSKPAANTVSNETAKVAEAEAGVEKATDGTVAAATSAAKSGPTASETSSAGDAVANAVEREAAEELTVASAEPQTNPVSGTDANGTDANRADANGAGASAATAAEKDAALGPDPAGASVTGSQTVGAAPAEDAAVERLDEVADAGNVDASGSNASTATSGSRTIVPAPNQITESVTASGEAPAAADESASTPAAAIANELAAINPGNAAEAPQSSNAPQAAGSKPNNVARTAEAADSKPEGQPRIATPVQTVDVKPGTQNGAEMPQPQVPLALDAVETEGNMVYAAGTGNPGKRVRIYVDETYVGETLTKDDGRWLLETPAKIAAGNVVVRADEMTEETVVRRAEVPFLKQVDAIALLPTTATAGGGASGSSSGAAVIAPKSVIIRSGDNLWTISRRTYGRGIRYTTIYRANDDQIRNPNLIYPGQVFVLPEGEKTWIQ